jgi:hypothetical protein
MGWSANSAPSVAEDSFDHIYLFWQGANNQIFESWYVNQWYGPEGMGWTTNISPTSAINPTSDHEAVYWQGANGHIYEAWYVNGWNGPQDMGWRTNSSPAASQANSDNQWVFWEGTNGSIYETWDVNGWNGPLNMGWFINAVGVYGGYGTTSLARSAMLDGWPVIGDAAALGTPTSPYTAELSSNPDGNVIAGMQGTGLYPTWMSFWTVSWPAPGDTFYNAGYQGGRQAASTLDAKSSSVSPTYVILDPEGYNTPASTSTQWQDFINGWSQGVRSVNNNLTPAFYANQSQFSEFGLSSLSLPGFVAVSPILGVVPSVRGNNVYGYIAYTAACPAVSYESSILNWGGTFNTLQFSDSGVDCGP